MTKPAYPHSGNYLDALRWAAYTMDEDDPSFPFICGVLSFRAVRGYITEAQAACVDNVLVRLRDEVPA